MSVIKPTLRAIIEDIKPQKLSNTCLTAFKPCQDIIYLGLHKTTLYEDVAKLCLLKFNYEQTVLVNKMMPCLILYGVVNAFSVFLYLEIINKGVDDITYDQLVETFNTSVANYVTPIVQATLNYLNLFVPQGENNSSNKELSTRIDFSNVLQTMFLEGTVSPQDVGLDRLTVGGLTQTSIDAVTDKYYRYIAPYLANELEIINNVSDTYYLNNYYFPASLEYFTKYAPEVLGIPIPQYVPNYPPTDDIHLQNFLYSQPVQSPAEESTGIIYFALFDLKPDEPVV